MPDNIVMTLTLEGVSGGIPVFQVEADVVTHVAVEEPIEHDADVLVDTADADIFITETVEVAEGPDVEVCE